MLSPDARTVAIDLLRPPPDHTLDVAVLTTFSLDLEALLALPLAVLAHADGGVEELLTDPLLLLEALRQAGERVHVFVDERGIAIPRTARSLYAMLEGCVHPVRARNGGVFHPKVWLARFKNAQGLPLLRVAVMSRNLTFDRSWDIAVASEAKPGGKRCVSMSRPLGALLRSLPDLSVFDIPATVAIAVESLAAEAERTRFPSPGGFTDPITFHSLGLGAKRHKPWRLRSYGMRLMAIAPFANQTALDTLASLTDGERVLVSRQETLDAVAEEVLDKWDPVLVLSDCAADEPVDEFVSRPSGLHAKLVGIEHGWDVTWFLGSANLTAAAFTGRNVEMMASVTGRKGRQDGLSGVGIERFKEAGFLGLCEAYRRSPRISKDERLADAQSWLDTALAELVNGNLCVLCSPRADSWEWAVEGTLQMPDGVVAACWPISLGEDHARKLVLPVSWNLPTSRLTAFVAFRLSVPGVRIDDVRVTLKLPTTGMPEERIAHVLRALIDTPERFLRFLRALLGGLDGPPDWPDGGHSSDRQGQSNIGFGCETLLEDLVRVASQDPARLGPIHKLIEELRTTEEGRQIVTGEFHAVWSAVWEALQPLEGS